MVFALQEKIQNVSTNILVVSRAVQNGSQSVVTDIIRNTILIYLNICFRIDFFSQVSLEIA